MRPIVRRRTVKWGYTWEKTPRQNKMGGDRQTNRGCEKGGSETKGKGGVSKRGKSLDKKIKNKKKGEDTMKISGRTGKGGKWDQHEKKS